jgi:general secretion pathway protein M
MRNFSNREKYVLISGGLFLVLFFGIRLGILPIFEKRDNYERILKEKQIALEEMVTLQQQFQAVSSDFDSRKKVLSNRKEGFSLFSFLDAEAQKGGLKDKVAYMTPSSKKMEKSAYSTDTVKFKLTEVYLKELMDLLYHIETSENGVTITALLLTKTGKNNDRLDAVIETETLMLKDKG